ncbi:MAG: YfiR family protein [candidate division KSB1 bacterium]
MKIFLLLVGFVCNWAPLAPAQEMEAPIPVQYALLHKLLAFDRNLKTRVGEELVIGILYQDNFRGSLIFKEELAEVIQKAQVDKLIDLPVRYVAVALVDQIDLAEQAARNRIDIFYVAPLRAVEMKRITTVSQALKILTFTGVPAYVEAGLSAGIGTKGESPRLLINVASAKAEGVEFSALLLRLAKIVE